MISDRHVNRADGLFGNGTGNHFQESSMISSWRPSPVFSIKEHGDGSGSIRGNYIMAWQEGGYGRPFERKGMSSLAKLPPAAYTLPPHQVEGPFSKHLLALMRSSFEVDSGTVR
ncbi:hypothetical protein QR685DRAFT_569712 [Neurospora intermedia]|uniref:Uncharacterized protein n=1 Tax=Neurospora intermedia TaxID=5142 RepID=A0ABR3DLY1_NEUIN